MQPRPRRSTLFPYTTLFRSQRRAKAIRTRIVLVVPIGHIRAARDCVSPRVCDRLALQERSEEHTSELQSQSKLVCRLLREKKKDIAVARNLTWMLLRDA